MGAPRISTAKPCANHSGRVRSRIARIAVDRAGIGDRRHACVEAAASDYGLRLTPGNARRNVVTTGVSLNHLVGREFTVGEARLRGMRLCEPCEHLAELTGQPVVKALIHRGGLRAEIVSGGVIRVGDPILPAES